MLEKALVFSLGLAVGGPASYFLTHSHAAQPPVTQYVTVIRRVPVPVHDQPLYQLASLNELVATAAVPGASIETGIRPDVTPGPMSKPALPERDEAENKLLQCVTPRMRALWDKVEEQFGQRFKIICTCDHSYYVAGTRRVSWHVSGNAIDFLVPEDRRYEVLAWLGRHHDTGLTMTYNDSKHVHIDVGGYVHMALAGRDRALRIPGANAPARYVSRRRAVTVEQDDDDSSN